MKYDGSDLNNKDIQDCEMDKKGNVRKLLEGLYLMMAPRDVFHAH